MPKKSDSLRYFVFKTLLPLEKWKKERLHIEEMLDYGYETWHFNPEERRFGTFITYGILRHWFELSHTIRELSSIPLEKMDPAVRLLLRMGLFQLCGMTSVPDFAALSSTLQLATELKLTKKSRGFINAILNRFIREGKPSVTLNYEKQFPAWWLTRMRSQYDPLSLDTILKACKEIPTLSIRINSLKISPEEYLKQLDQAGIPYEASGKVPEVVWILTSQGSPKSLPGYKEGLFIVQDESSAEVAHFLNPEPGETILEIGAAPGSKTTHLAALMKNRGQIIAVDRSAKRMEKLEENLARLGVTIVKPLVANGESIKQADLKPFLEYSPDRILIDAPCSGTGTIGKHPEILLTLRESDFKEFAETQTALLLNAFDLLKPGGVLIYSTCSLDWEENQKPLEALLNAKPDMALRESETRILPDGKRDGFYMAKIFKYLDVIPSEARNPLS